MGSRIDRAFSIPSGNPIYSAPHFVLLTFFRMLQDHPVESIPFLAGDALAIPEKGIHFTARGFPGARTLFACPTFRAPCRPPAERARRLT